MESRAKLIKDDAPDLNSVVNETGVQYYGVIAENNLNPQQTELIKQVINTDRQIENFL